MKGNIVVVIPIYKSNPNSNELISFRKCIQTLSNYSITIAYPENLDITEYTKEYPNLYKVKFNKDDFNSISSYNKLCLSKRFYQEFQTYEYMLIYQLDAYVFKNDLETWCQKGYSYIGAPWFENFDSSENSTTLWAVGNGGFSLRKITDFLAVYKSKKKIFSFNFLWEKYQGYSFQKRISRLPKILGQYLFKNNTSHLYELFGENEDHFWSFHAQKLNPNFKIPPPSEALKFAFECNPKEMFKQNNDELPFGVHAWEKYNPQFWKKIII